MIQKLRKAFLLFHISDTSSTTNCLKMCYWGQNKVLRNYSSMWLTISQLSAPNYCLFAWLTNFLQHSRQWSVKCYNIYFPHLHLDFCPENLGVVIDKHGKKFPQDIATMEEWYPRIVNPSMLADYWWTLQQDITDAEYKWKTAKQFYPCWTHSFCILVIKN